MFVFVFDCHDFVVADVDNAQCCLLVNSYGVQRYISQSAAARLVAAMVISHLDYFNSIYTGTPADQIARLQRVQKNAARLVIKKKKKKTRSRNTASQGTSLATREIPLSVQDRDTCLPPF